MNLIDRVINVVSPKSAFKRTRYRIATSVLSDSQRKYDAAAVSRRTDGWQATGTSPNNETIAVLSRIRYRSRELVRNNPYAKRAIQVIKNNTVGTGIRPTPSVASNGNTERIKNAWWRWAETTECDWNGKKNFYGLQRMVIAAVAQDGEVIIRKRRVSSKSGYLPVKLQICEADQIDDSMENPHTSDGGWIIQGVEFNKSGQVIAYWLYDRHPGDSYELKSVSVPADEVLHVYAQDRPGQVRGVPWSSTVMIKLRDYDDFEDAQLMQQKIAACFAAFVTKDDSSGGLNTPSDAPTSERIEPGIIEHLQPGEEVSFATPPSTTGQESFSRKVLQAIAAGNGITYESLTGDLSNVNFSSGRMGWIEMHRNIQEWQDDIMILQFCDPVFNWFVQAAKMKGYIETSEVVADWTPPRREMIDPTKEVSGLVGMMQAGLNSWQDVVRQMGYDPDLVLKQIIEDIKKFDDAGLKFSSDYRNNMLKIGTQQSKSKQDAE